MKWDRTHGFPRYVELKTSQQSQMCLIAGNLDTSTKIEAHGCQANELLNTSIPGFNSQGNILYGRHQYKCGTAKIIASTNISTESKDIVEFQDDVDGKVKTTRWLRAKAEVLIMKSNSLNSVIIQVNYTSSVGAQVV
jgi:hypothetical protein